MWPKLTKGFKSAFGLTCQFVFLFYFAHGDQNTYILESILSRAKIKHLNVYMVFYLPEQLLVPDRESYHLTGCGGQAELHCGTN